MSKIYGLKYFFYSLQNKEFVAKILFVFLFLDLETRQEERKLGYELEQVFVCTTFQQLLCTYQRYCHHDQRRIEGKKRQQCSRVDFCRMAKRKVKLFFRNYNLKKHRQT